METLKKILGYVVTAFLVMCTIVAMTYVFDHVAMHMQDISYEETKIRALTNNGYLDLFTDTETNVMYVRTSTGTLTVMVNADGSPKLYTHEYK